MNILFIRAILVLLTPLITFCSVSRQESYNNSFTETGKWKLIAINEESVLSETYTQGIPYLEIKKKDAVVSGFTGCNLIQGQYEISGNQIRFQQIISTKKYCKGIPEQVFLKALEKVDSYTIKGNELFMLQNETRLLYFIKSD